MTIPFFSHHPPSPYRRHLLALLGATLGIALLFAYDVRHGYDQALDRAKTDTANIAKALDLYVAATVRKVDIALLAIAEEVGHRHTMDWQGKLAAYLRRFNAILPEAAVIRLVDTRGRVIASSLPNDLTTPCYSCDTSCLTRHRGNPNLGLYISEPQKDEMLKTWVITLNRRLTRPDGSFAGIVSASVPLSLFEDFFGAIDLHGRGNITLLNTGLITLARSPAGDKHRGKSVKGALLDRVLRGNPEARFGNFRGKSGLDGVARTYAYRFVGSLPLIVVVGKADQDSLATWRGSTLISGLGMVLLLTCVSWLSRSLANRAREDRESKERLRDITAALGEGVYVLDNQGRISFVNPEFERLLGWSEAELLGKNGHDTFHYKTPDGNPFPIEDCPVHRTLSLGQTHRSLNDWLVRKDGSLVPVSIVATSLFHEGIAIGSVAAVWDIGPRLEQERRLCEQEERFRLLFNNTHDAIMVHRVEPDGRPGSFVEVNQVANLMLGYSRPELLQMGPADIDDPDSATDMAEVLARLNASGHALFERIYRTREGRKIPVEVSAHRFELQGRPAVLSVIRDISKRKQVEEEMRRLAEFDSLTDLPNRRLLGDRLRQALFQARRYQRALAVMFLDLDRFKEINDTLGHDVGDQLLKEAAVRLSACVRGGDTVARQGGDEFVIVLSEIHGPHDAELVAEKIIKAIRQPFLIGGRELTVTTSVGIAIYPVGSSLDGRELLKMADMALYAAKDAGRDGYRVYEPVGEGIATHGGSSTP